MTDTQQPRSELLLTEDHCRCDYALQEFVLDLLQQGYCFDEVAYALGRITGLGEFQGNQFYTYGLAMGATVATESEREAEE